jgi:hypothetical protein
MVISHSFFSDHALLVIDHDMNIRVFSSGRIERRGDFYLITETGFSYRP